MVASGGSDLVSVGDGVSLFASSNFGGVSGESERNSASEDVPGAFSVLLDELSVLGEGGDGLVQGGGERVGVDEGDGPPLAAQPGQVTSTDGTSDTKGTCSPGVNSPDMKALFATLTLWTATLAQRQQPSGFRQQQPSNYQQQPSSYQQRPDYDNYPTTAEQQRNEIKDNNQQFQKSADYVSPIPIIRLSKQMSLDGTYKSSYETANSIIAEESGFLKPVGVEGKQGIVQYGTYSYTDPDGKLISVKYTADEGGFRAEGEHLPTPPPVPPEVQKGLDIIFESIKQRQLQEAEFRKTGAESANFPPEDDGSYKPSLYPDNRLHLDSRSLL
uniref:Endocuticle structural glycoprotein SgAbd-2 n=2 Tax=Lygus hesperus TaxID=30085 RepID=A0A0K8SB33_LYGHE